MNTGPRRLHGGGARQGNQASKAPAEFLWLPRPRAWLEEVEATVCGLNNGLGLKPQMGYDETERRNEDVAEGWGGGAITPQGLWVLQIAAVLPT